MSEARSASTAPPPREPPERDGSFSSWGELLEHLEERARGEKLENLVEDLESLVKDHPMATEAHLVAGRIVATLGEPAAALTLFEEAARIALPGTLDWRHPFTADLVQAALALEESRRPWRGRASRNLRRNLTALRRRDPRLAAAVAAARDPSGVAIVDVWGRLMLVNRSTRALAVPAAKFFDEITGVLRGRNSVAVFGVGSGQEVLEILARTPVGFMGATACHYVIEEDPGRVRLLLQLADIASAIEGRRLMIFGGEEWPQQMERHFATRMFPPPAAVCGSNPAYRGPYDAILERVQAKPWEEERVRIRYRSDETRERLLAVAEGKAPPRILFLSCRWTTVLKHMGATFRDGFERLGCATRFLIEESDGECITRGAYCKVLEEFRPDVLFCVSHARPSCPFMPPQLPVVGYIMDNCGPILTRERLDDVIAPVDLFLSINRGFRDLLAGKGVPEEQIAVVPTPSDETVYHPLAAGDPLVERFRADVSWMKHAGDGSDEQCLRVLEEHLQRSSERYRRTALRLLREIHRRVTADRSVQWFDADIQELAWELLDPDAPSEWRADLRTLLVQYKITAYAASFRQHFLEPLAASGLDVRLYGNGWERHPTLSRLAGGVLRPGSELNAAYNGSTINLHIHNEMSMHQRLVEGALAGGFFLVNRLDPERDYEPLAPYFEEGKEVVLFDSGEDLVEKCRYYLAHPEERRAIAERMRARAMANYTVDIACRRILDLLRARLRAAVPASAPQGEPAPAPPQRESPTRVTFESLIAPS